MVFTSQMHLEKLRSRSRFGQSLSLGLGLGGKRDFPVTSYTPSAGFIFKGGGLHKNVGQWPLPLNTLPN